MASCPDSDNSWVLAGSENLPVETLGPEPRMDPESEGASQALRDSSKADGKELAGTLDGEEKLFQTESSQRETAVLTESAAKGTLGADGHGTEAPGDTVVQEDSQETPVATSLGPDTQDLESEIHPQNLPSSPRAVWKEHRCSSSDDDTDVDVEGLRRRRGREPSSSQPVVPVDVEDQAKGEGIGGELGISLNMCFLGALVLLGLGILLFSGTLLEPETGVADCARQEGLALFGVELAPVRQQELASVLREYLSRLPWAGQLTKQLPLSPAYFGEDGIFRHDRLRFRDFVDALEDSLEEVALKQTGDDDEVDDFEDFVFGHFFGDKALKKRSRKKEKHSWNPRVVGPREEHSRHPHHYHQG